MGVNHCCNSQRLVACLGALLLLVAVALWPNGASSSNVVSAAQATPVARPLVPVSPAEVVKGDPGRPWVSLVVNAGAGYRPAAAILDTLAARGVHTTFFLLGYWAEQYPDLVRRMASDGHEIASHGHSVFDLTSVSDAEVIGDLERAELVISAITGRTTRPLWSPSAGYRDARVRGLAASIGYRPIFWTLDSGDWRTDASAEGVRHRVLANTEPGDIVVMHFDSPHTADSVAAIWPDLIDGLQARGFRLVTITELVTGVLDDAASAPAAPVPSLTGHGS